MALIRNEFQPTNIAANGTTQAKTGSGVLHSVTINKKGASSNVLSIYDATSGTTDPIATIDTTDRIGTLLFDCKFKKGLRAILGTGTAADVTLNWR